MDKQLEQEFSISDELYEISEATNRDGTVDVEIYDFEKLENVDPPQVSVKFYTPTGDKKSEAMNWPIRDTASNKFVRICRETVGSLSAAKFLKQDGAIVKANPENWEIDENLGVIQLIKTISIMRLIKRIPIVLGKITKRMLWVLLVGSPIYAIFTALGVVPVATNLIVPWSVAFIILLFYYDVNRSKR